MTTQDIIEKHNIKFIVDKDHLKNKLKKIQAFDTSKEKELLLLEDDATLQEYCDVLGLEADNDILRYIYLIHIRNISVGTTIESVRNCSMCKKPNNYKINLEDQIDLEIDTPLPIGVFSSIDDIIDEEVADNLNIKEYNIIEQELADNLNKLIKSTVKHTCMFCNHTDTISIDPRDIMSTSTLVGFYREIFNFGFFMNTPYNDVMSMLPFERSILNKMITTEIEKKL